MRNRDGEGRRSLSVNEKGLVTVYKYDAQSRLETVYYPFSEELKETARKEAEKQGLYFVPSQGNAENYFISSGEMAALKTAAERIAWGRSGSINVNQIVWKESYTYDANGNRTSKTTPWGTVKYAYDKENRLVESGDLGKSESVRYTYDRNGNLLSEIAGRYQKDYVYNAQNRMAFSEVLDRAENTRNLTEYRYDAFGRRIETIEYLGDHTRNLYDGFSFDIAEKKVLNRTAAFDASVKTRAGSAAGHPELGSGSASTGRSGAGVANGTRYRYIGDEPLENAGSAGAGNAGAASAQAGTTAAAKTRSRPNSEYVLYSNGEPVAVNSDNGVSYFGTDILGSVRSVTDRNGQVKASYEYDAFGTPYLSNLENDVGFGYTGKIFDSATGLYDYGFRDYAPNSARFTTVDPVRDGSNWFSYCMNDAVNYVDLFGLTSNDICYTVQPGDCVWKIADKYDCTTQQVIDNNNFSNPNLIHPGDKIYIPVATPATATDTGSTISVATPSNNGSNNVSTNTTNGGSFGSAPTGGGAGNASMGGGTGLSNIASSMYAAASMNNAASATVTAQASPEIHNAAAEPTLLEKAHNILDILGCFSDIPDGINALLYLYEGNQKEAALCAICFLPFGDAISKGRKVALNAIPEVVEFAGKHADDAVDAVKVTRKQAFRQAKEAAGIPKSAQFTKHKFVFDGSTENRMVYEFDVGGKKKYIIEHAEDKYGRGKHFHGADDLEGSPFDKIRYNQYEGHFPEDINGYN